MLVVNSAQMREIDRIMIEEYQYPGLLLMETAGRKAAEFLRQTFPTIHKFLILCGPGYNGGDGLVIARYLTVGGMDVRLLLLDKPTAYKGDAKTNFNLIQKSGISYEVFGGHLPDGMNAYLQEGAIIVDALFGSGTRGKLKDPAPALLDLLRGKPNPVVAIDMPSGLIGDTGAELTKPLRCQYTFTFHLPKYCHYITPASRYCGKVVVGDIHIYSSISERLGVKSEIIDDELVRRWYHPREADSHKGTYGHVLLAGGSKGMAGAIALASNAAIEIGAGKCTAFIPGSISCSFHRTTLENMSVPYGTENTPSLNETAGDVFGAYTEGKSVVGIGPGLGVTEDTASFLAQALTYVKTPLILDADALNILADNPKLWERVPRGATSNTIITPHPGEMARLMGISTEEVQEKRYEIAHQFAAQYKVIVVLKGAGTIICAPNGAAYICAAGNPGMASAGTGDTLMGAIAGLISQGYNPLKAAALGVYLHAKSGDMVERIFGHEGVTASKMARYLGAALKEVLQGKPVEAPPV